MKERLGESWWNVLKDEFDKQYMKDLQVKIVNRRKTHIVYPASSDVFNAYEYTSYDDVKVVILGQD